MKKPALIRTSSMLLLLMALGPGGASAVTIYRCGAAGNSFSDMPCANGRAFEADDARSAEQRGEALRVVDVERRLAAELQTERLRAAAALPEGAAGFGVRPTRVALAADDRRDHRKRLVVKPRQRWLYDDRDEFIAFAPPAAGKPRQPR